MITIVQFEITRTLDNLHHYEATIHSTEPRAIAQINGDWNVDTKTCHVSRESVELLNDLGIDEGHVSEAIEAYKG